ncbi:MAG: TonB-dependent receptor [Alphaproteobacteria bacterium]
MRHFLIRTTSIAAIATTIALPVWAQDAAVEAETSAEIEASAETKAPPAIPEIIVTAQKRSENVQDVPLSVTAVAGDLLEARAVDKVDDIGYLAPNLDIAALPRSSYIRIRGLGSGDNKGFEQSIGLFVDGIYYGRAEYLNDAMIDIERIEVLRGPQGTLFGKNTVAGALNITTRDPSTEWEVYGSALFGEYNQQRFEAAVNIPFWSDVAGLRIAAKDNQRDGYIYNRLLDRDEANLDKTYARAKLGLLGTETFELVVSVDYGSLKARGNGYQLSELGDDARLLYTAFDPNVETDLDDYETSLDYPGYTYRDTLGATATAKLDIAEHELAFIAGWSSYEFEVSDDVDFGPAPLLSFLYDDEFEQYSGEIRLTSPDGPFEYVAGLYYFFSDYDANTDFTMLPDFDALGTVTGLVLPAALQDILALAGPSFNGDNRHKDFMQETTHIAAYGQANLTLWEDLELIAGLRYTTEEKDHFQEQTFENGGIPFRLLTGDTDFAANASRDEDNWSPKFAVKYAFLEDAMAYVTYAKGFKAGGFNEMATSPDDMEFNEELSDTIEGGIKSTWFNRQLTLNLTYFYTSFENLQVAVWDGTGFVVTNAEEATTQGLELESMIVPVEGLFLSIAAGWIDATYDSFKNGPCLAGQGKGCDLSGDRLNQAPEFNGSVSALYEHDINTVNMLAFIGGDVYYQTEMFLTPDLDKADSQEAYTQVSARIGLRHPDNLWSFSVIGKNLLDETIKQESFDVPLFAGSHFAAVAPPRTFSARFAVEF